jgi:uncharacterized protein YndB with AHSA1/START domain
MAFIRQSIAASVHEVWAVLIDPSTYPVWLVGARKIRRVDPNWPDVNSAFHHRVGVWPMLIEDKSIVREIEPERLLVLEVRASPIVRAIVRFQLSAEESASGMVLEMEEEPAWRLIGNLARPILDPLTHLRNKRSLADLATLATDRAKRRS